jgi:hypothetical protein
MFSNITTIIYFILIGIIIVFGGIISYENKARKNAVEKLSIANAQLVLLQQQSMLQKQKIDDANKQSQIKEKATQEKLRTLMKITVPKDCNQSIQWGIKQAYEF